MNVRSIIVAAMSCGAIIAAAPATAQQRASEECRTEARALCAMDDRAERRSCMREKVSELSEGCRAEFAKMREARANGEGGQRQRSDRQGQGRGQGQASEGAMSEGNAN